MTNGRRGSRTRSRRQTKRTILLVTNGEVTEKRYLDELKQRARKQLSDLAITVKVIHGEPPSVLKKLSSPRSDTNAYDEVWFIFDEDGHDRSSVYLECDRRTTRKQQWYAVVSRPCFEAWLIAHYEPVRRYADQANAQVHYRNLIGTDSPTKQLPQDFPYEEAATAVHRSHLRDDSIGSATQMPPSPGSGMPHLLKRLGIVDD